ncbi:MAG: sodium:dicarboxylate symporter [Planctomycetota bacterium]
MNAAESQTAPAAETASARRAHPFLLPGLMLGGALLGALLGGAFAGHWAELKRWTASPEGAVGAPFAVVAIPGAFNLLGEIFMNLLKMLVIPLIVFSVMFAVAGLGDLRRMSRLFGYTIFYFLLTMTLAVIAGMTLVNVIQPGKGASTELRDEASVQRAAKAKAEKAPPVTKVYDLVRGMFPANLFKAAAEMNVLGLIMFSLFFGAILGSMGERGARVTELIGTLNEALMQFIYLVIWFAPLGIMGLVAERIGLLGGFGAIGAELQRLAWYALTVVLGLLIHGMITLPLLLYFIGRKNPWKYAVGMSEALLTAFTTASSAATLPVTIRCMEEKNGVSPKTVGFVVPLGATVNMNGTALYEAVAALFIAQAYGVELDFAHQLLILVSATLAAIGAAAIPEAGLITMILVLVAAGLPVEGVGLILSIDWILDRCRTTVNVWDDAVAAGIVDRWASTQEPQR